MALIHEVITFGLGHQLIRLSDAECLAGDCSGIGLVVFVLAMNGVLAALILAVFGTSFAGWRRSDPMLALLWLTLAIALLTATANGYRVAFGNTWAWHEPFLELMFHPVLTPGLLLAGVTAFWVLIRRKHPTAPPAPEAG